MSNFDLLKREVDLGVSGKNRGIPMGFEKLNKYISIRKRIYSIVFGSTGSGKTSLVHDGWILNPFDYYIEQKKKNNFINMRVILFSMERSKIYTLAKWIVRKIYLDQGVLIPIGKLLGWWDGNKLTHDEHDMFLLYEDYINMLTTEFVDIIEGAQNPTGVHKYLKQFAEKRGKIQEISEFNKLYVPDDDSEIVVPIIDHLGLTKVEKGMSKKESIDKLSEYLQHSRDFYGYTPVAVSQINRDLSNPMYAKSTELEPSLDQIKESGRPAEDSDAVISLFDPLRYNTTDKYYSAEKMVNKVSGAKHFRSLKILKNTYGEDDIRVGMAFHGSTGTFAELPHVKYMDNFNYDSLFSGEYFLKSKIKNV
jgi:hypothetical protein